MEDYKKSFWTTLPGILTGIAALITAIGGILLIFIREPVNKPLNDNPISKIVGQWTFEMHSKVSDWTISGSLTLDPVNIESNSEEVKGRMISFHTGWNKINSDIKGTFNNNKLILSRETGVDGILQNYDLTYFSSNSISGTYKNNDDIGKYKDNGTLILNR